MDLPFPDVPPGDTTASNYRSCGVAEVKSFGACLDRVSSSPELPVRRAPRLLRRTARRQVVRTAGQAGGSPATDRHRRRDVGRRRRPPLLRPAQDPGRPDRLPLPRPMDVTTTTSTSTTTTTSMPSTSTTTSSPKTTTGIRRTRVLLVTPGQRNPPGGSTSPALATTGVASETAFEVAVGLLAFGLLLILVSRRLA
jgi:hypothetical protein